MNKRVKEAEERLDKLFSEAFQTNDPVMLDWVEIKFELKRLRLLEDKIDKIRRTLLIERGRE